jgi:hypothetical protein
MCTGRVGLRESKMRLYFTESERERARALAALLTLLLFSSFGGLCSDFVWLLLLCCACSLSVDRALSHTAHLFFQFWTYWSLRFMRWMLLVVVASAISVACRAALWAVRAAPRPPPAPLRRGPRAHTARTAAGGGRVSRARQATPRTHTCTCTCTCACDMSCACACGRACAVRTYLFPSSFLCMCVRVWPCPWAKDLPTLTPVNRRPISDVR